MAWFLKWTLEGERGLARLDRPVAQRVMAKLESILDDPERFLFQLTTPEPRFKLRAGDYRAVVSLDYPARIVWVRKVGHRKNVYDNV